jgi:hypothetical protein
MSDLVFVIITAIYLAIGAFAVIDAQKEEPNMGWNRPEKIVLTVLFWPLMLIAGIVLVIAGKEKK